MKRITITIEDPICTMRYDVTADVVEKIMELCKPEVTYKAGDRFIIGGFGNEYILASTGVGVCLISLIDGNRWREPVFVDSARHITESEMCKIAGEKYRKKYRKI